MIKYGALLIGICYLANPLHHEIGSILHGLSHFLEAPETILDHGHEHETHAYHQHDAENTHEHSAINFIDSLFDAFDGEQDQKKSVVKGQELDKHLNTESYSLQPIFSLPETTNFAVVGAQLKKGYPNIPLEPPRPVGIP